MLRSSLENENEARIVPANDFKQKEDLKMYIQLPYYDDFQGYDLGVDGILGRIAHQIYANFHKPSWQTLKHRSIMEKIPKELSKELKSGPENDKKGEFKQEMMYGRVEKKQIANTSNGSVEMDFVRYVDFPRSCAFRTLCTFRGYYFYGGEKERWASGGNGSGEKRFRIG